ncbi:MAG TPA: hypothetical protein VGJ73_11535 [Verrucomicrobiae bacterium]
MTEKLALEDSTHEIEASDAFHRTVVARLRAQESSQWRITGLPGNLLNWRVVLPGAAVCVALIIGLHDRQMSDLPLRSSVPTPGRMVSTRNADADVLPTIGNYQMAAEQSLQEFDDLLNREAKLPPPPAPSYRVSTLTLADVGQ